MSLIKCETDPDSDYKVGNILQYKNMESRMFFLVLVVTKKKTWQACNY